MGRLLYAVYSFDAPRNIPLEQTATRLHNTLQGLTRNELAHYAAGKQNDARVPVVAGGSAPAPTEPPPDINKMTDLQRQNYVREIFRQSRAAEQAL